MTPEERRAQQAQARQAEIHNANVNLLIATVTQLCVEQGGSFELGPVPPEVMNAQGMLVHEFTAKGGIRWTLVTEKGRMPGVGDLGRA